MPRGGIEPFYFGMPGMPLFGCYHTPQTIPTRACGVILCYPMGQEYIQAHRAYRQLAVRLSDIGFPVLRFDFYGCGDSSGDCERGEVRQWLTDVSTAIGEIRLRGSVERVCLVGLRFGGTLAMMAGAARGDVNGMALWDPVVSGKTYIQELTILHREMLPYFHATPKRGITGEKPAEILGFPLTDSMLTEINNIDLLTIQEKPAKNILVLESSEEPGEGRLKEHLKNIGAHVEYKYLPSPPIWIANTYRALVPQQSLQSVVSWISEVYP
jgi:pimeloyl-ACP methyl ester carboxylesterase